MSTKISLSRYLVEQQRVDGLIPAQLRLLLEVVARARRAATCGLMASSASTCSLQYT